MADKGKEGKPSLASLTLVVVLFGIFFGSFSFINGAQFEQLIRAIAANAVGYAIKLAIQAMCSPCGAILETLEEAIRDLNALAKNTCAISMASLTQTADKMMEHGRKIGEALSVSANRSADATAATNKSQSERPTQTATGGDANTAKSNPVLGNMVWRAAQQTMDSGNNTLRAFMSSREVTEMVQSIFGTVVVRSKEASDGECTAGASSERCDNKPLVIGSAVSHWDKLLRARSASPQGVGTPEDFKKQIEIMTAQLTAMRPQSRDVMDMIDGAYKVIQQSQTLTVSPVRSSNNQR